jgi:hypothetical protein
MLAKGLIVYSFNRKIFTTALAGRSSLSQVLALVVL